jgi:3-oxoacyl-[acyl-carrier protein] reductase
VEVKRVLITGTTSGLGRALLDLYTRDGVAVVAVNRRRDEALERRYPAVRFEQVDVRAADEIARLVSGLAAKDELPEVVILNAGINRVDNDESFDLSGYREVFETNLYGVLNFVAPLMRLSGDRRARHVVAIGSMVTVAGNPYGLGYFTSKRALTACFDVWSAMYAGTDLVFKQVVLGPVRTGMLTMADRLPAWMGRIKGLASASVEDTARAVARFARNRRSTLVYPVRAFPLFVALAVGRRLIPGFFRGTKTLAGKDRRPAERR